MDCGEIERQIDSYFEQGRGEEAEALMRQSIAKAVEERDDGTLLFLLNELLGYYRETSRTKDSFLLAEQAAKLARDLGLEGTVPYATTLLNIANAYRAGGRLEDSLDCYREAEEIYRGVLAPEDMLMASLYNNKSLLYQEMGKLSEAKECLRRAMDVLSCHEEAYFELAVTCANLASTCLGLDEDAEGLGYLEKAIGLFEAHGIEDAHYSAALSALGTYCYKRKDYRTAAAHFKKAMDCMKKYLGENEYYHRLKANLEACERAMEEEDAPRREPEGVSCGEQEASLSAPHKGLEICRAYYEAYGAPMLREKFPEYLDRIAVGLVGEGSDCFGFDDEISRDHDWGPEFCLWVTQDIFREIGERLQEEYELLPHTFRGFARAPVAQGKGRRGVQTINGFYGRLLGDRDWEKLGEAGKSGAETALEEDFWMQASDAGLAASTNGEVYSDPQGIFSAVRELLWQGYPERILYLKLAQSAGRFSQAGQYNYPRMLRRGDFVTADILLGDCLREAARLCYYAARRYPPHDKWLLFGLSALPEGEKVRKLIGNVHRRGKELSGEKFGSKLPNYLLVQYHGQARDMQGYKSESQAVLSAVERLGECLARTLYRLDLISDTDAYLDAHTGELLKKAQYASLSEKELVDRIARLEFAAFDKVQNEGGRAFCQDDWPTFCVMRKSQYLTWNRPMLLQYLFDFEREYAAGHNLIEEKYGRMMESTAPGEYERIRQYFPVLDESKKAVVEAVVAVQVQWMEEFAKLYPALAANARNIHTSQDRQDDVSYETYLRGEISTYSDKMLDLYGRYVVEHAKKGCNLACEIMSNSVKMYGYGSLQEAEDRAMADGSMANCPMEDRP